jgi:hypothetical protein
MRAAALALVAAGLALSGCVSVDARGSAVANLSCPAGEDLRQVADLAFGRNIGQTLGVSETDFARFLDEEVSPRFPDGFSVADGQGRWLYRGVVYNEPNKQLNLILLHPGDRAKLAEIAAAYETLFHQDAVLIRTRPECVRFHMAPGR